jgi:hypothetical protein
MKPLRDRTGPMSPIEASAIALLRAVERGGPPSGSKQRVRARVFASHAVVRPRLFRPAFAAACLLLAAGASAAVGGTWVIRQYLTSSASPARLSTRGASERAPAAVGPDAMQQPSALQLEQPARAKVDNSPAPIVPVASATASDKPLTLGSSAARNQGKPTEQDQLVFDSMRALRRDGQPERAAKLLDEYLRRHPNGALAEEALALAIEAATMRGEPRAKDLANRYLARYPSGQFHHAAERARARFSP